MSTDILCRAKTQRIEWDTLRYPLVVKPVDGSASVGVHICLNEEDLRVGITNAIAASEKGSIIIEEYVQGNEFTAHYTISGGNASLSCVDNRYPVAVHGGSVTTIPAARIYPSIYTEQYMNSVNPAMIRLCESLNLEYGVVFVQGIYNPNSDQFWIFEGGLEAPLNFLAVF